MQARWRVACTLGAALLGPVTGCERLLSIQDPVADDGRIGDAGIDGGITDAAPAASSPILLSEVVVTPNAGEMIELVNTSNQPVDLSTYYLSDSGNYYRVPVDPTHTTVDSTDFIVKFPTGATIAGHTAITVAVDMPANFMTAYGKLPSFSLVDGSMTAIVVNGTPNLTNGGEPIILFQWDGNSDLVHDVDIMLVGAAMGANGLSSKSRLLQDGPDPGSQPSQYAVDANTIKPQTATPGNGQSAKRILLEGTHEVHSGTGNGQAGDDETSEDTMATWEISSPVTPGQVPAALTP
jgi:hypothetical protein